MTRQPIYVAYAVTSSGQGLMPLCWHTSKQRVSEVGEALAKQDGLAFYGAFGCNHADYQAITYFPDHHRLNQKKTIMTTADNLAVAVCPLVEFIKTEIPEITSDLHAQRLAEMIITVLPDLFTEKPEIFSEALSKAESKMKNAPHQFDWVALLRRITNG